MSKITVSKKPGVFEILARGSIGVGRDYFYLTSNVLSGVSSSGITFQATLQQSAALNRWQILQETTGATADEELQLLRQYDWSQAPDWAMYAAIDANGSANWFALEPTRDESRGRWVMKFSPGRIWPMHSTVRAFRNWRDSLWERPEGTLPTTPPTTPEVPATPLSATVVIEVSNDSLGWIEMGSVLLDSTTLVDGFVSVSPWAYVRARVSAVSGTDAFVTVTMGV